MHKEDGKILLVDKPTGWTSFDVVKKIRNALQKQAGKKVKVGHAGTLDPLATGLLIICTGKNTKQIEQFQNLKKTYSGSIKLGQTTPSYDAETEVNATFPIKHINENLIKNTAHTFIGKQMQLPPAFSAKKIKGKTAYKLARKGEKVTLKPAEIEIFSFDVEFEKPNLVRFKVVCSKGTYIRSLAYDFGKKLNSGAHLNSLRREAIGDFKLERTHSLKEVVNNMMFINFNE